MMGERVNLPEVIFFYWLQAFKDLFHAKDKKNLVPYGMFFTQIMRNSAVDVFVLKPFARGTQHRGLTFVKMWKIDNFPKYAQKHIKRKVNKEEPQFIVR